MDNFTKKDFMKDLRYLIEKYDGRLSFETNQEYYDTCEDSYACEPCKTFKIEFDDYVDPDPTEVNVDIIKRTPFVFNIEDLENLYEEQ